MSVFITRKFNKALFDYLYATLFTGAATVIEDVDFTGTGLDDLSTSGTYVAPSSNTTTKYTVIATAGDTFKWSNDNGTTYTSGVAITGAPQALSNGVSIAFAATTGHTTNDQWVTYGAPATAIRVYCTQTLDQIFLGRITLPCYVIVTGGQVHAKKDDCETEYTPKLVAVTKVFGIEDTVFAHNPASKYMTVNDLIDNAKAYINSDSLVPGMITYGYASRIVKSEWRLIDEPVYILNDKGTNYIIQTMQLYFKIL